MKVFTGLQVKKSKVGGLCNSTSSKKIKKIKKIKNYYEDGGQFDFY